MATNVTMTYGSYSFSPVPLMTYQHQFNKTNGGVPVGHVVQLTLEGTLTAQPDTFGDIVVVDALQDELVDAFSTEGQRFYVNCGASGLLECYPRINAINLPPTTNNWVTHSTYTIEMEFDVSGNAPFIDDASDEWTIEFMEDVSRYTLDLSTATGTGNIQQPKDGEYYDIDKSPYLLRMTHNVSAHGRRQYNNGAVSGEGYEQARDFVLTRLGFDDTYISGGAFNLDPSIFNAYNHMRTNTLDEYNGSFSVSESWIVMSTGESGVPSHAIEDWTANVSTTVDTDLTTVSIDGNIQGVETRDYGSPTTGTAGDFTITEDKYTSASSYWTVVADRLYSRAQLAVEPIANRNLNINPLTTTLGKSPSQGSISYSYTYDDRPQTCITGALSEVFSVQDTHPSDVFASLVVLGRVSGPILQDINTRTHSTRDVTIEAVMPPVTICPTTTGNIAAIYASSPKNQVDPILCAFEQDLQATYDTVFLHNNVENWDWTTGRYSRQVGWTFINCGTSGTSLC